MITSRALLFCIAVMFTVLQEHVQGKSIVSHWQSRLQLQEMPGICEFTAHPGNCEADLMISQSCTLLLFRERKIRFCAVALQKNSLRKREYWRPWYWGQLLHFWSPRKYKYEVPKSRQEALTKIKHSARSIGRAVKWQPRHLSCADLAAMEAPGAALLWKPQPQCGGRQTWPPLPWWLGAHAGAGVMG